jgi:hypothetical protein
LTNVRKFDILSKLSLRNSQEKNEEAVKKRETNRKAFGYFEKKLLKKIKKFLTKRKQSDRI